ncbi:hypothetical protein F4553_004887 [Allocatelliglobosispora scoriae]|uniref:Uncharacterized protein n=1 Tax=Allocatelliglobosispora scoriae TaxID=643052 RepID=A0A841BVM5_9ACTN|nr:hypothetical protein [Allocatelliglobosispora scoriae]MBB5871508.1 hypothetical protein [Allocatelliglobosispora scoriae]
MKTWGRVVGTAAWFAALVGLAQLGLAAATGAVHLSDAHETIDTWSSQLVWLVWFAGLSVLAGTVAGAVAARHHLPGAGLGARVASAFAAAIGTAAALAPALLQARRAQLPSGDPVFLAAVTMGVGTAIGLLAAIVVLSHRSFGWNTIATIAVGWLLFGASVGLEPDAAPQLGVVHTDGSLGNSLVPFALPVIAGLIGIATSFTARRQDHHRAVVAISGSVGPALIGFAYAIAGPGQGDYQHRPWLAAMIAVGAGLLGSLIVGVWPSRSDEPELRPERPVRPIRPDGTTITAEIPVSERDAEHVGWVSGLTDSSGDRPMPPRQRRSSESSARDSALRSLRRDEPTADLPNPALTESTTESLPPTSRRPRHGKP